MSNSVSSKKSEQGSPFEAERVREAFASIAPKYVAANHLLSGGIDVLWRRRLSKMISEQNPRQLLDVATGTGDLALEIQKKLPDCRIVASDFCQEMLDCAQQRGVKELHCADALHLPFEDGSFDAVTVAFGLRNMSSWSAGLVEMSRVLSSGGRLYILDFSLPEGAFAFLRAPYRFYLHRVLPVVAGFITGNRAAYEYLGSSIESFPSGAAMEERIAEVESLEPVETRRLTGGVASIYVVAKV